MAKYINKYPTIDEYTEDTAARDALGKTVSLIDSTGGLHYDVGNKSPTPVYILLNNFISPMPTPRKPYESGGDNRFDNFINTVPSEWPEDYQDDDLVSSTTGTQMLDSRQPINFSSKNISVGTPCGIVTEGMNGSCPLDEGPSYAIASSSVSNGCTIELWYNSYYFSNRQEVVWLVSIGHTDGTSVAYPNLLLTISGNNMDGYQGAIPNYYATLRLTTASNTSREYEKEIENWADGKWHHYALTYDASTNFVHLFIDGYKMKSITDATDVIRELFSTVSYMKFASSDYTTIPRGRFAQIAVYNQCKWTENFEVPTVAY